MAASADVVPEARLWRWVRISPAETPTGTPMEFLPVCGVVGLGRLLVEAGTDPARRDTIVGTLLERAADPRWRVREAVAMALQRWGAADMRALLGVMRDWASTGDRLVQRAVVAALCEPALLGVPADAAAVVDILDELTSTLLAAADRRTEPFRVLRQALGYGWSVAIVAAPEPGWTAFERWAARPDPDVRWMVRENLGKHRLRRLDPTRVELLAGGAGHDSRGAHPGA